MQEEHVQYLVLAFRHLDRVELPDVGVFIRRRVPARYDALQQVLHPPSEHFECLPYEDGATLRDFLSQRFHLSVDEAQVVQEQMASRLVADLNADQRVELAGIGVLELDASGSIQWIPASTDQQLIHVPVPILAGVRHEESVVDKVESWGGAGPAPPEVEAPVQSETESQLSFKEISDLIPRPRRMLHARRSPLEQVTLVLITALLLGILVSLFIFRKPIIHALGIGGGSQSAELTESDAEIEAELLSGHGFVTVDTFGRQGQATAETWTSQPGTLVYHIIVGSEIGEERASSRLNEWQAKGYRAVLVPGPRKNSWRISIYQATKLNECDRKLAELKLHSLVPYDTWTLKMQY